MISKKFYLLALIIVVFLCFLFIYYFVLPARVISVAQTSKVVMRFNKPVERRSILPSITPNVPGEWRYEQPISGNHLFTALAFVPEEKMNPKVQYEIELGSIKSFFNAGLAGNYSFSFKPGIALAAAVPNQKITLIDIAPAWQKYKLSCEAASLKMALSYKGVDVSEDEIMQKIGYDTTSRQGAVWGNPNKNFVGDINGQMCNTGYGVYWKPVALAASTWRAAEYFSNGDINKLVEEIESGNPVIVWGTLPVKQLADCSWHTADGEYIKAIKQDHVRLVVGFMGEPNNPTKIILNDPLSGRLYWDTSFFLNNWKAFNDSGVVIK
jgi:uncharacterized protein YvpB